MTSKSGKKFTILKLSDLVKYNMPRIRAHLEKEYGDDQEGLKLALRNYNVDGYKQISVMAFGESALPAKSIPAGSVVALMNPRLMPPSSSGSLGSEKSQQGMTVCITTIDAVVKIGFSKDFNICVRESINHVTQKPIPCYRFVNTSVEKICETHRKEL